MCFSFEMSAGFAALGFILSIGFYLGTRNIKLALGIFYFFVMEFLQAIQYLYIAPDLSSPICATDINKALTIIGFIHICFQPFFCWVTCEGIMCRTQKNTERFALVERLCLIGGFLLLLRYPLSFVTEWNTLNGATSTEWLRGRNLCTFKGERHLSWSVPLSDPTYLMQGVGLHSFLMFAPFVALWDVKGSLFLGTVLFLSGPILASYISKGLMEQASIWCFFSITQITVLLIGHFLFGISRQPEDYATLEKKQN